MAVKGVTAVLGFSPSKYQEALGVFLDGMKVNMCIDGKEWEGVVTGLDIAPGQDATHCFAQVWVDDPDHKLGDDGYQIFRVALNRDGTVNVMPEQSQDA